jgi:hypothetical protein
LEKGSGLQRSIGAKQLLVFARLLGGLALLTMAACTGPARSPFLSSAVPTSSEPQPEYPLLFPSPRDAEQSPPLLTEDEQKAMEMKLEDLASTRERVVRRRLERSQ